MIFERHKSEFKQPGWTRVQIAYSIRTQIYHKEISNWVKSSHPDSRYYYSFHTSAYWIEKPEAVTEMLLRFSDNIGMVNVIEHKTPPVSPMEKQPEPEIQPDLFQS